MRIAFTLKIAPVISQADVSHNGLFIGLWTEAEVSLGFIVACSLCLPKLIQAKGRRLRNALSYASAPWSSLTSKSRKSSLWSRSGSRKSTGFEDKERGIEVERPMYSKSARSRRNWRKRDFNLRRTDMTFTSYLVQQEIVSALQVAIHCLATRKVAARNTQVRTKMPWCRLPLSCGTRSPARLA
jgi:hypothetical protein